MSAPHREVTAFAPATVANLGSGFDVLGLAVRGPGDFVTARLAPGHAVRMGRIEGDNGKLPLDAAANTAGIAAIATLRAAGVATGVELDLRKGMPIGSGLGSSAASAVAAAVAVNALIGGPLRRADLVLPCVEAEAAVAGRHADNVAPSILGGLILVRSVDPLDIVRLPVPDGLLIVVATPEFELPTREARAVLPRTVPLPELVRATAQVASLVAACHSGDLGLLGRAVQEHVVTPARVPLIPGCARVISAATDAGALGSSISGAGPSIFALCHSPAVAARVADAMVAAFRSAGLGASAIVSPADCPGARLV